MDLYIPTTDKEFSQKKLESYNNYIRVIQEGRKNPNWFIEWAFGIKLFDYQKWCVSQSWYRPFVLWLECRGAGKSTLAAVFFMTKLLLIPDYQVYIFANTAQQSADSFMKLQNIALQRIPSFKSCTDLFANEVYKSPNSDTGFLHAPQGYNFQLFNGSGMTTLSSNLDAIRGKRGSVYYDETAFQSAEALNTTENFANVDANFGLSTNKIKHIDPVQMPLQLLYASSAGDATFPFFKKYKEYAYKMLLGDDNYFVCDLNVKVLMNHSSVDGELIKSHLSQAQVDKELEDDPDLAERELFNKFRKGAGENSVVSTDTLVRNSEVRKPMLRNVSGKDQFVITIDPARTYDGSIVEVFRWMYDDSVGWYLSMENSISMVDKKTKRKTPLPMPQQIDIIHKVMLDYNGDRAAEWENIEIYIDAGAGGGGVSAIADSLMEDWIGSDGMNHRGVIDPDHPQYKTARERYTRAYPIVHLVEPRAYKSIMYDSLEKMCKLDLMKFTQYDGKDYIIEFDKNGEVIETMLTEDEKLALMQIELTKNEVSYMVRNVSASGTVQYELEPSKRNTMHDDRAYALAEAGYALARKRREDLVNTHEVVETPPPMCVSAVDF